MNEFTEDKLNYKLKTLKKRNTVILFFDLFYEIFLFFSLFVTILFLTIKLLASTSFSILSPIPFTLLNCTILIVIVFGLAIVTALVSAVYIVAINKYWIYYIDEKLKLNDTLITFALLSKKNPFKKLLLKQINEKLTVLPNVLFPKPRIGYRILTIPAIIVLIIVFALPNYKVNNKINNQVNKTESEGEYEIVNTTPFNKINRIFSTNPKELFGDPDRKKGTPIKKYVNPLLGIGEDVVKKVKLPDKNKIKKGPGSGMNNINMENYKINPEEGIRKWALEADEAELIKKYFNAIKDFEK